LSWLIELFVFNSRVALSSMKSGSDIASQKRFHVGECIRVGGEIREGRVTGCLRMIIWFYCHPRELLKRFSRS
jgi:hypothetical protein